MQQAGHRAGTLAPGEHHVVVDGVRQVHHVAGRGPVCVVLPGGPGCHYAYAVSPHLEQHFTVVYPEPVGTGASDGLPDPGGYRMQTYVRFLDALLEHLDAGPVVLLGHSYGGCVALRYALQHPAGVRGLVLYDTTPVLGADLAGPADAAVAGFAARHHDRPEAVAAVRALEDYDEATDDAAITEALRAIVPIYVADFWGRREQLAPLLAATAGSHAPATAVDPEPFDVRDRLGRVAVPTLVLAGEQDFICGPRWARVLHDGIPGSRLVLLEDCGHFGHHERPHEFTRAVVEAFGAPS